MKTFVIIAVVGLLAAGCGKKKSDEPGGSSTTGDSAGMHGKMDMAKDSGTKTPMDHGGMSMSGDMEKDMKMMSDMMVQHLGAADSTYEQRFIHMMIPHHEGAVLMAQDALQKANKPELKKLAEQIIEAQKKEIAQMKSWSDKWYGAGGSAPMAGSDGMMKEMGTMNQKMVTMLGAQDKDYEDRFIDMMIPHHEGAIAMAKDALQKATKPEMKRLAESIIADQQKEIKQMEEWRKTWYGH